MDRLLQDFSDNRRGLPDLFLLKQSDPLFVDPDKGNFRLLPDSPCVDAGTNNVPELPSRDLDGNPRILNATDLAGVITGTEYSQSFLGQNSCMHSLPSTLFTSSKRNTRRRVISNAKM